MDITPLVPQGSQVIHGYGPGMFRIADTIYRGSVLVFPDRTMSWDVDAADNLVADDFRQLIEAEAACDILLLGCGQRMQLPTERVRAELRGHGIVIDPMDTGAACRTFNVLLTEGRRVAAALIVL
ncbi:MAG: Mth938-like domain-containing protein [Rhodospirillales bacterium]|nr:MAG: Mth938-like domain-containing protein [Rhodospirillales bacterium]